MESFRASPDTSESASTSFHGSAASESSSFLSPRATSLARARQRSKAAAPTMHARGWDDVDSFARPARMAVKVLARADASASGRRKPRCDKHRPIEILSSCHTVSYDLLVGYLVIYHIQVYHYTQPRKEHKRSTTQPRRKPQPVFHNQLERRDDGAPRPRRGRRRGSRRERRTPCLASGSCALRRGTSRSRS